MHVLQLYFLSCDCPEGIAGSCAVLCCAALTVPPWCIVPVLDSCWLLQAGAMASFLRELLLTNCRAPAAVEADLQRCLEVHFK